MARYETRKAKAALPVGTKLWAYAFTLDSHKENMALKQEPVLGQVTEGKYGSLHFAPIKKSGDGLVLSKSIHIDGRDYADTEEEAKDGYNEKVQDAIRWHQERISALEKELI